MSKRRGERECCRSEPLDPRCRESAAQFSTRIARRRDAYPKGERRPDRPVFKAEVVTGATDRSRSVDIRGLGALDGVHGGAAVAL